MTYIWIEEIQNIGLPSKDTLISNGNVIYRAEGKIWECLICHQTSNKYNRNQMINHVDAKHNAAKESLRTRTERGTHVEKRMTKSCKRNVIMGK